MVVSVGEVHGRIGDCRSQTSRKVGNNAENTRTGANGARVAIKAQVGTVAGSTQLFPFLRLGSIVLSIATEVIFFIYKVYKKKKEVDRKEMPWDEFQRSIVQLIFEGLFGLGGGLTLGFLFSLIPFVGPF